MNIYLLKRQNVSGYDEADGFVVAAPDSTAARSMAARDCGDEGEGVWLEAARSKCHKIGEGTTLKAAVILRDFHAG